MKKIASLLACFIVGIFCYASDGKEYDMPKFYSVKVYGISIHMSFRRPCSEFEIVNLSKRSGFQMEISNDMLLINGGLKVFYANVQEISERTNKSMSQRGRIDFLKNGEIEKTLTFSDSNYDEFVKFLYEFICGKFITSSLASI